MPENSAYVKADLGQSYVAFSQWRSATPDISDAEYPLELFWFEIDPVTTGERDAQPPAYVSEQKQLSLDVPGQGNWVAVLLRKDSVINCPTGRRVGRIAALAGPYFELYIWRKRAEPPVQKIIFNYWEHGMNPREYSPLSLLVCGGGMFR